MHSTHVLRSLLLTSAVGLCGATAACGTSDDLDESVSSAATTPPSKLTPEAVRLWNAYVGEVTSGVKLQKGCEPTRFSPEASARYRGVIILFHGFSACPQQYFELAHTLTKEGFEVLLPLLPGHGREPIRTNGGVQDDIRDLPKVETKGRYTKLAVEMNEVARAATGTRVVGGLSVGGAVATAALEQAPDLYTRGLVLSPFYTLPLAQRSLIGVGNAILPSRRIGWGASCVKEREQPNPRAGICEFEVQHVRAAAEFGEAVAAQASRISVPVQMTGVEDDTAADNSRTMRVSRAIPKVGICFYPKGVNHSLLSRFDSPGENKFWIPSAITQITNFVRDGAPFRTDGKSNEGGIAKCAVF